MAVQLLTRIRFASNLSLPLFVSLLRGLRPLSTNTAVLTLRHGCGDIRVDCSPMAAHYGIAASSQLKLRPSTPIGCTTIDEDSVCKQPILALYLCPCFAGLRPRAPNTAVLTLSTVAGIIVLIARLWLRFMVSPRARN